MADAALLVRRDSAEPASAPSILRALEEDIVFGRLHPRERLIEEDLAARFAAKRHVVRQVLADLERMGLVERVPNRGATVRAYAPDAVEQLYAVRDILETSAARLIPMPMDAASLDAVKAVQARHDEAVAARDLRAVFRANIDFHRALFATIGNSYLTGAIDDFAQRTHAIRFYSLADPGFQAEARDDHWAMLSAIEAGDREGLVALCRSHLQPSKNAYLRAWRERFPE